MPGFGVIRGTVKNASTLRVIAGATVKLSEDGVVCVKTTSNAEGEWAIVWQAGTYTFKAMKDGYYSQTNEGTIKDQVYGDNAPTLNMSLKPIGLTPL